MLTGYSNCGKFIPLFIICFSFNYCFKHTKKTCIYAFAMRTKRPLSANNLSARSARRPHSERPMTRVHKHTNMHIAVYPEGARGETSDNDRTMRLSESQMFRTTLGRPILKPSNEHCMHAFVAHCFHKLPKQHQICDTTYKKLYI